MSTSPDKLPMGLDGSLSNHDRGAATTAATKEGLLDAKATLAELWRRTDGEQHAKCMQALEAVITAEQAMNAADAFVSARTNSARREAFQKLRVACIRRCDFVREKP